MLHVMLIVCRVPVLLCLLYVRRFFGRCLSLCASVLFSYVQILATWCLMSVVCSHFFLLSSHITQYLPFLLLLLLSLYVFVFLFSCVSCVFFLLLVPFFFVCIFVVLSFSSMIYLLPWSLPVSSTHSFRSLILLSRTICFVLLSSPVFLSLLDLHTAVS